MKLWLALHHIDYEGSYFVGVFSTKELAELGVEAYMVNHQYAYRNEMVIGEVEVDKVDG